MECAEYSIDVTYSDKFPGNIRVVPNLNSCGEPPGDMTQQRAVCLLKQYIWSKRQGAEAFMFQCAVLNCSTLEPCFQATKKWWRKRCTAEHRRTDHNKNAVDKRPGKGMERLNNH